jgi:hypothetical protein
MTKIVFLFGHRKQHGKDTCCDITEKILSSSDISFLRRSFASKLKKHCAERYNLDVSKMESDEYKKSKPEHLNGLTVREVLLKEGNFARSIWENAWTFSTFNDIFESDKDVALISDFRYPNEVNCFSTLFKQWSMGKENPGKLPEIVKILVHRENGRFNSDGSDDQLPDLNDSLWDETILNNVENGDWYRNLFDQVQPVIHKHLYKNLQIIPRRVILKDKK